jgi:hypothetical protein
MAITGSRGGRLAAALVVTMTVAGSPPRAQQTPPSVAVYKTATCGCCTKWVDYMRAQGFDVKAQDVDDIGSVKATFGVPPELSSCHTSLVGGYVIEGHVPADVIKRLLRERPKVAGLAVPGMPAGSPGMEQPGRRDPYAIVSFDRAGQQKIYERR